jgi:hypothetical protein
VEVSRLVFSCFLPYAHQLLSHLLWSVLRDLGLDQILSHSMKRDNDEVQQKIFTATCLFFYISFFPSDGLTSSVPPFSNLTCI